MTVSCNGSGYFEVEVSKRGILEKVYAFTARTLGRIENAPGTVKLVEDTFRWPILANTDSTSVDIVSSHHLPFAIQNLTWEGVASSRASLR
jgi:hypothetical protein